jgi:histidine kinase-like protein
MIQMSLCLVSCMVLGLGLLVWRARPEAPSNRSFGAFTLFSAIWILGVGLFYSETNLVFWATTAFAGASLVPAAFLSFVRYYPTPTRWLGPWALRLNFSVGLFFAVVSLTTRLIVKDARITSTGPARETGALYPLFAAYFLVAWLAALVVLLSKWSRARGLARVQLHYLALGFAVSTSGGIAANLVLPILTGITSYNWIGPLFSLAFVALSAHGIIRHRVMDVRLVIHRGLTFTLALAVSLVPVGGLLVLAWPRLSEHLSADELAALIAAIVVVSILIPLTRDVAGRLLDRYVYRTHVNYQRTLREASEALTRVLDLKVLLQFMNHTVATSTNSEGAAVYLKGMRPSSDRRSGGRSRRRGTRRVTSIRRRRRLRKSSRF